MRKTLREEHPLAVAADPPSSVIAEKNWEPMQNRPASSATSVTSSLKATRPARPENPGLRECPTRIISQTSFHTSFGADHQRRSPGDSSLTETADRARPAFYRGAGRSGRLMGRGSGGHVS